MGTTGTYLFIPFMLLVVGFFAFLFYHISKGDAQMTEKPDDPGLTRPAEAERGEAGDELKSEQALENNEKGRTKG